MTRAFSLLISATTILLSGCEPNAGEVTPLSDGIIYCSEGNPDTFNPQLVTSGTTVDATAAQLYDRLIDYDAEKQAFVPALAKRWEPLDNGTRYRFYLREGVEFHSTKYFTPTRTFNAEDVRFSFNR